MLLALGLRTPDSAAEDGLMQKGHPRTVPVRSELLVRISALAPDLDIRWIPLDADNGGELGSATVAAVQELADSLAAAKFGGALLIESCAARAETTQAAFAAAELRAKAAAAIMEKASRLQVVRGYAGGDVFRGSGGTNDGPFLLVTLMSRETLAAARESIEGARRMRGYAPPRYRRPARPEADPAPPQPDTGDDAREPGQVAATPPAPRQPGIGLIVSTFRNPPVTFNGVAYEGQTPDGRSYAGQGAGAVMTPSVGIEALLPGSRIQSAVGARYRKDRAIRATSDFGPDAEAHNLADEVTGSAIGAWYEAGIDAGDSGSTFHPCMGLGLDLEVSNLKIEQTYADRRISGLEREEVSTATSRLAALSGRLSGGVKARIGSMFAALRLGFYLPIAEFGRQFKGGDDPSGQAIEEALDHRAQVGSEFAAAMGMYW